jgi:hypothetical protein
VRQRLLNQAHEQGKSFQELLQYFVMERFLYRLWAVGNLGTDQLCVERPTALYGSPVNTRRFSLFPFLELSLNRPFCQSFVNFTIGRMALH